jgi:hypothetical protein
MWRLLVGGLVIAVVAVATPAIAGATTSAGTAAAATCSRAYLPLPDPVCTPGVTNPAVTQGTINSTICVPGWTSTIRPPTSYTNPLKVRQIAEYGYRDTNVADYEEDHYIPLELGGSPRDAKNLWPEARTGASGSTAGDKDTVENKLKRLVCAGQVRLVPAQRAIVTDWRTAVSVVTGQ